MTPGFYLRQVARDSRGARGRLLFFTLCLAVGIAAVVAVAALAESLDRNVRGEAKSILGGDVAVEGRQPVPEEARDLPLLAGAARVEVRELPTMAATAPTAGRGPRSQLVELKVVDGPYPLYGTVETAPAPFAELLARGAVVAPELLHRLGLEVGDPLRLGETEVTIAGVVTREPDRVLSAFALGPRVLVSGEVLDRSGLETFGSRIGYRTLWRLPGNAPRSAAERAAAALEEALAGSLHHRVESWAEAQPSLREGLDRVERFLGLVALLSLLIGGVGVAQSIRSWINGRLDAIAVLGCLGMRPREAFALHLGQALLLGLAGSVLGGLAGLVVHLQAPRLLGDLVPAGALSFWQPAAFARGLTVGIAASLLFALPPLLSVLRVPPLRALRHDAEPLPAPRWLRLALPLALAGGVFALAAAQSRSLPLGLAFTGGLLVVVALLAAAARGLERLAGRLRRAPVPLAVRQGAASLSRPASDTLAAMVALGIGVLVVLHTVLVERHLTAALEADLPRGAPSAFMVDVQPDQWPPLEKLLRAGGATAIDSVPVIMARLAAIDGRPVEELAEEAPPGSDRRWALTREQRLTYLDELPPDNQLAAGALWADPAADEVSLEEEFAAEMGVGLGATLTFDVQGVEVPLVVTSLRTVDWRTFRINFFVVAEPGVLDEAPQSRIAAADLPLDRREELQGRVSASFPNVTVVDVREILDRVAAIVGRLAQGVRFLGGFTALAGLAILVGAVAAGAARRGRELALLKTLGFTRPGLLALLATEHLLLGGVAAALGTAGAIGLSWLVVTQRMELDWHLFPGTVLAGFAVAVLTTALAGLGASLRSLGRVPVEVLRSER